MIAEPCTAAQVAAWHYAGEIPPEQILYTYELTNVSPDAEGGWCADKFCLPASICKSDICALVLHQTVDPYKIVMSQLPARGLSCEDGIWCIDMVGWKKNDDCCQAAPSLPCITEDPCGRAKALQGILDNMMLCQTAERYSSKDETIWFKSVSTDLIERQLEIAQTACKPCRRVPRSMTVTTGCRTSNAPRRRRCFW